MPLMPELRILKQTFQYTAQKNHTARNLDVAIQT